MTEILFLISLTFVHDFEKSIKSFNEVLIRSRQDIIKMEAGSNYDQIIRQTTKPEWKKISVTVNNKLHDM